MAANGLNLDWNEVDRERFASAFRAFHAEFTLAMDQGVDLGTLLAILEGEGVELPDFVRMML